MVPLSVPCRGRRARTPALPLGGQRPSIHAPTRSTASSSTSVVASGGIWSSPRRRIRSHRTLASLSPGRTRQASARPRSPSVGRSSSRCVAEVRRQEAQVHVAGCGAARLVAEGAVGVEVGARALRRRAGSRPPDRPARDRPRALPMSRSKRPMWLKVRSWLSRASGNAVLAIELEGTGTEDEPGRRRVATQAVGAARVVPALLAHAAGRRGVLDREDLGEARRAAGRRRSARRSSATCSRASPPSPGPARASRGVGPTRDRRRAARARSASRARCRAGRSRRPWRRSRSGRRSGRASQRRLAASSLYSGAFTSNSIESGVRGQRRRCRRTVRSR